MAVAAPVALALHRTSAMPLNCVNVFPNVSARVAVVKSLVLVLMVVVGGALVPARVKISVLLLPATPPVCASHSVLAKNVVVMGAVVPVVAVPHNTSAMAVRFASAFPIALRKCVGM